MPRGQTADKKTDPDVRDSRELKPTLGFGVPATSDPHHFKVRIPPANSGKVQISEYLGMQACSDEFAVMDRVMLDRPRWTTIRSEVQRAFNARLKAHELRTSAWKVGENPVDRLLGKELCVLAWAVEDMEMDKIPVAVRNWLVLRPEERWWLFGMTGCGDRNRKGRRARLAACAEACAGGRRAERSDAAPRPNDKSGRPATGRPSIFLMTRSE